MDFFNPSQLYDNYHNWKEQDITHRLFKPEDIERLILLRNDKNGFQVDLLGHSVEGRGIYSVQWGKGKAKIMLWSQMHGDEPTATMAFMDLFNFLSYDDNFNEFRNLLSQNLSLHFIPVLNPDGTTKYQRRNAMEIDINRDAIRKQTPEAKILDEYRRKTQPDWAFNMHDQRIYYTVGDSLESATISFLAPSYDQARSINAIRTDAMSLIGMMSNCLKHFIPGKIARYTDKFYPTSFGDNFQKFNARSILVEAGGFPGDPEKQYIRKLHFILLLCGFHGIASEEYKNADLSHYESIPENSEKLYDLIIRHVHLEKRGHPYRVDLAFKTEEIAHEEHWDFVHQGSLVDLGDLSVFHGYKEFNAQEYIVKPGKVYMEVFPNAEDLTTQWCMLLLKKGVTDVRVKHLKPKDRLRRLPVRLVAESEEITFEFLVGKNPSLFLEKDGINRYAVVNGFLIEL